MWLTATELPSYYFMELRIIIFNYISTMLFKKKIVLMYTYIKNIYISIDAAMWQVPNRI